ncbi:MAG: hypothetical protein MJZ76_06710 [Bacteroidales bacterium]|nr:hypothetical protein [Bacteroidales bacterium]
MKTELFFKKNPLLIHNGKPMPYKGTHCYYFCIVKIDHKMDAKLELTTDYKFIAISKKKSCFDFLSNFAA